MWRYFPGSIKECLKSKCSQQIQPKKANNQICCYVRKLIQVHSSEKSDGQFDEQRDTNGAKDHRRKTWETNYSQILQRNLIGALGWSGILVLGWYLSQPSCFRTRIGKQSQHDESNYVSPTRILVRSVLAQPLNQILPKTFTSAIKQSSESGSQFVNDTLDQAVDNFAQAHGSVENRLGVELARRQRHKDAAALFQRATDRGHATAAFNLGLCYELGLGTVQDFRKAAELYELASLGGHATATYNLGVFYVHGWGGKEADRVRARQLFVAAAHLGQVDARKALGMTERKSQRTADPIMYKRESSSISQLVKDTINKYTSLLEA